MNAPALKLPAGLKAYEPIALQMMGWMPDWLSQHDFDRLVQEHQPFMRNRGYEGLTGETFILGGLEGLQELHLLKWLVKLGLVEERTRLGIVYYRNVPEVPA